MINIFTSFQVLHTCYTNEIDVMLLQENGHSTMYTWILSTGWWEGRAPINLDAVVVVGLLCTCLVGGFVYINRFCVLMPYRNYDSFLPKK